MNTDDGKLYKGSTEDHLGISKERSNELGIICYDAISHNPNSMSCILMEISLSKATAPEKVLMGMRIGKAWANDNLVKTTMR